MTSLLVLGAGGHGAVVAEAALAAGSWDTVRFLDDAVAPGETVVGCEVLGTLDDWAAHAGNDGQLVVAIGRNRVREDVAARVEAQGGMLASVIHPNAVVSPSATIGAGAVVFAGAVINARASIGSGAIINTGATVDHDCIVGDFAHVSPGANIAGEVTLGARSWVGIGAAIRECLVVGADATVGAGSSVVADVAEGATVVGVPAQVLEQR